MHWETVQGTLTLHKDTLKIGNFQSNLSATYTTVNYPHITFTQINKWVCCICSFCNDQTKTCLLCGVRICDMCKLHLPTAGSSVCNVCTFANNKDVKFCEMCGADLHTKMANQVEIQLEFKNFKDFVSLCKSIGIDFVSKHGLNKLRQTQSKRSVELVSRVKSFRDFQKCAKELAQLAAKVADPPITPIGAPSGRTSCPDDVKTCLYKFLIESNLLDQLGAITLPQIFQKLNRVKGLALFSPQEILNGLKLLNLKIRKLRSGLLIVELPNFSSRLMNSVNNASPQELARSKGLSVQLVLDELLQKEENGELVRDESIHGLRFYKNMLKC